MTRKWKSLDFIGINARYKENVMFLTVCLRDNNTTTTTQHQQHQTRAKKLNEITNTFFFYHFILFNYLNCVDFDCFSCIEYFFKKFLVWLSREFYFVVLFFSKTLRYFHPRTEVVRRKSGYLLLWIMITSILDSKVLGCRLFRGGNKIMCKWKRIHVHFMSLWPHIVGCRAK